MLTPVDLCSLLIQEQTLLTGFQRQRANIHKALTLPAEQRYKCKKAD